MYLYFFVLVRNPSLFDFSKSRQLLHKCPMEFYEESKPSSETIRTILGLPIYLYEETEGIVSQTGL